MSSAVDERTTEKVSKSKARRIRRRKLGQCRRAQTEAWDMLREALDRCEEFRHTIKSSNLTSRTVPGGIIDIQHLDIGGYRISVSLPCDQHDAHKAEVWWARGGLAEFVMD